VSVGAERDVRLSWLRTDHFGQGLSRRSAHGALVTVGARGVKIAVNFAVIAVLARVIAPHDFGLVAMAAVVFAFVDAFRDFGLSQATVQRDQITPGQVSTLFWVNVALGALLAATAAAAAPLIAAFYGEPALTGIVRWLALGMFASSLSVQHVALLRRQLRFGTIAAIELAAEMAGLAVALGGALDGWGYWALVAQRLAAALVMAASAWTFCSWTPSRPRRADAAGSRALLRFGGNVAGFGMLSLLARTADQMLIGWAWGAVPLGFYERSYRLIMVPITYVNAPLAAVAIPTLCRLAQAADSYRRAYLTAVRAIAAVTMPVAALLIGASDWVIAVVFGPAWSASAPILAFLGIAALIQPVANTTGWLFVSQDRTGEMLRWGAIGTALSVAAVVGGLPFGAVGVAASYAVTGLLIRTPILFRMAGARGPVSTAAIYRALAPAALATVVAIVASLAVRFAAPGLVGAQPAIVSLVLSTAIAAVAVLAFYTLTPLGRPVFADVRALRRLLARKT
jgi:PST family polysaccharide transporter